MGTMRTIGVVERARAGVFVKIPGTTSTIMFEGLGLDPQRHKPGPNMGRGLG